MKVIELNKNFDRKLKDIRPSIGGIDQNIVNTVSKIVEDVRRNGDSALFKYTRRFDKFDLNTKNIKITGKEIKKAKDEITTKIRNHLKISARRIREYQKSLLPKERTYRDRLGNELGFAVRPIDRVGIYVPGGKAAYPSTVLMTAIPALVAGVKEIAIATPAPNGELNSVVLAAASISGVSEIYRIGGAQAISALAYGTDSVPKADKIVGPGNIYVALAKKIVYGEVDIDCIAGPSEVLILSDGTGKPEWIAADLLAQAEHDEMAVPLLVCTSINFAKHVIKEVKKQLKDLQRRDIAAEAIKRNGRAFIVKSIDDAIKVSNAVAPEHLELCIKSPKSVLKKIKHAGAVFLGHMSAEAFGDYIAGPSHVLPTGGAARFSSPLSVYDFIKMPSVISVSQKGFNKLSGSVIDLAYSENLEAHALSVKVRMKKFNN
ncbi:MAG: histidinol dehydrogenase [Thermodesulfobacteriota bacterium]